MTILPVAYLGSVEYFARILAGGCTIDLGEHYVKRSQRNRARILTANGPMDLSVQLCRANHPGTPVRDMRIDYSKRWQHRHWVALVSAYRSSPFFDHYAGELEPFYRRRYEFLADYDLELTALLLRLLGDVPMPALAQRYVEAGPDDLDLRSRERERKAAGCARMGAANGEGGVPPGATGFAGADEKGPAFVAEPYFQLFSDRMPFVGNLSVIDLLFAEGPSAGPFLRGCLR
ncbi:WbqC family protein [Alistipes sp.]|jgi:hypothetical protein|uniref:WbqC family protein n=1 Tax=Alistipes sp. TaxID=1872444 RepID=UPI001D27150C|nr:WbqC family protein [Alistipes sp.]MBS6099662.1 WbqC family protein [Alistipes sp.]HJI20055.1 WbqC family protein [Rikenellaceae bacterium]